MKKLDFFLPVIIFKKISKFSTAISLVNVDYKTIESMNFNHSGIWQDLFDLRVMIATKTPNFDTTLCTALYES